MEPLRQALPYREWIVGLGLDSTEVGHPPTEFQAEFEEALPYIQTPPFLSQSKYKRY
jgi:adenosine deaminase